MRKEPLQNNYYSMQKVILGNIKDIRKNLSPVSYFIVDIAVFMKLTESYLQTLRNLAKIGLGALIYCFHDLCYSQNQTDMQLLRSRLTSCQLL